MDYIAALYRNRLPLLKSSGKTPRELNLTELKFKLDQTKANEMLLLAKVNELTSEVKNLQEVFSEKETGWKNQLDDLTKKNTRFQREVRKQTSQRSNAMLRLTESTAKLEETEKCLESLKKEYKHVKQRLEKDLEKQTSIQKSIEEKLNNSVQTNTELKLQNEEFSKENEKLQALNESLSKENDTLKRSLDDEIIRRTDLKKKFENLKAEHEEVETTIRTKVEVPLKNKIKELMGHIDQLKADAKKKSTYVTRLEADKKTLLSIKTQLKKKNDEWPEKYFEITQEKEKLAKELEYTRILLDKNAKDIQNLNFKLRNAVSKRCDVEREKKEQIELKDSKIKKWKTRAKLQLNETALSESLKTEYGNNLFKAQDQIHCLEQKISVLTDANALLSTEKESLVKATSSLSCQLKEVKMQLENTEQQLSSARNKDAQQSSILATKEMENEQITKELEITATELQNAKDEISDLTKKTQELESEIKLLPREKMEVQGKLDQLAEEFSKNGLKSVAMHVKTLLNGMNEKGKNKYTVGRLNLELESKNFMKKITEQKAEIEELRGKLHKAMAAQSRNLLAKRRIIDLNRSSSSHEVVIKLNNDKSFTGQRTNMVQLKKPCVFPSIGVEGRTVCGANLDDGFWMGVTEDAQYPLPPP
nr:putative leucine-rich repeat-containing protein DDB_G0290503 [Nothobranchius furzeri]